MADLLNHGSRAAPFPLKRVLVLSDLSDAAENAAWRAGLLAREHGAWLRIVHVRRWPGAVAEAQRRLDALAWRLQEHLGVAVIAQALRGGLRGELATAAADADLLVTRAAPDPWVRGWLAGVHPDRLVQLCGLPTLVVRKAAAMPYQRAVVGVAAGPQAGSCLAAASGMVGGPHVDLVRALGQDAGLLATSEPVAQGDAARIEERIYDVAAAIPGLRMKEAPCVVITRSAEALLESEQALFPDLMVVQREADALRPWLSPSLPRRLLPRTGADTLILPVAAPPAALASGPSRKEAPAIGAYGANVWPS